LVQKADKSKKLIEGESIHLKERAQVAFNRPLVKESIITIIAELPARTDRGYVVLRDMKSQASTGTKCLLT